MVDCQTPTLFVPTPLPGSGLQAIPRPHTPFSHPHRLPCRYMRLGGNVPVFRWIGAVNGSIVNFMELLRIAPRGMGDVHKMLFDTGGASLLTGRCLPAVLPGLHTCTAHARPRSWPIACSSTHLSTLLLLPCSAHPPCCLQCPSWRAASMASSPPCTCSCSRSPRMQSPPRAHPQSPPPSPPRSNERPSWR